MQLLSKCMWLTLTISSCASLAQEDRRITPTDPTQSPQGRALLWVRPVPVADTTLKGLSAISDAIVEGVVENVLPSRKASPSNIQTDIRFTVVKSFKTSLPLNELMISQTGGAVGTYEVVPQQYELMQPGQRYLLFLMRDRRPSTPVLIGAPPYTILGAWIGSFGISNNKIHVSKMSPESTHSLYDGMDAGAFEAEIEKVVPTAQ